MNAVAMRATTNHCTVLKKAPRPKAAAAIAARSARPEALIMASRGRRCTACAGLTVPTADRSMARSALSD